MACETVCTFFNVFLRFFSKSKKHDFLRFFELLHTFSRTVLTGADVEGGVGGQVRGSGGRVPRSWSIFKVGLYTTWNLRPWGNERHNLMQLIAFFIAVHTSIVLFQCHVAQCLVFWGHAPLPPKSALVITSNRKGKGEGKGTLPTMKSWIRHWPALITFSFFTRRINNAIPNVTLLP